MIPPSLTLLQVTIDSRPATSIYSNYLISPVSVTIHPIHNYLYAKKDLLQAARYSRPATSNHTSSITNLSQIIITQHMFTITADSDLRQAAIDCLTATSIDSSLVFVVDTPDSGSGNRIDTSPVTNLIPIISASDTLTITANSDLFQAAIDIFQSAESTPAL